MAQQTAMQTLFINLESIDIKVPQGIKDVYLQMEKEQMVKFAEFVSRYPDKNKNYQGEMLHAKSKYDEAERTIDLLEQYYNETYGKSI